MYLIPGDVILVWDRKTKPPKPKLHLCICPEKQLFLRINSEDHFYPNIPLKKQACPFLDHDSYLELAALIRHLEYDINEGKHIGTLSNTEITRICLAIKTVKTLTPEQKTLIFARLEYVD